MAKDARSVYPRRVYPLSPKELTEEQLAVVFAMTSHRPEPFDEIALQVSQEKAADFHERWVLGYGHASVAEHAILHMAVENISRLACDSLEDNRLASYTEKSSRYQVLPQGYYYVPASLEDDSSLKELYITTCEYLFRTYAQIVEGTIHHLTKQRPQQEGERDGAYNLRLRREAIDSCRFLLPAATLTNVGVTMNARLMEHAISKLLSSDLVEERELGEDLKAKGKEITPTLIKYAEENEYLKASRSAQQKLAAPSTGSFNDGVEVSLVHQDPQAELKLAAALLYRHSALPYSEVWRMVEGMGEAGRWGVIDASLEHLGPHDAPARELEVVDYTFELVMDYGAFREFKRHRMQTYIPQPLGVSNGYVMPPLMEEAGLGGEFATAMDQADEAFWRLHVEAPVLAQYLVTHAHKRRVLAKMNLRECYHLFKLRTQSQAHFSIRWPIEEAMRLAVRTHPRLFKYLKLRDVPGWWNDQYGDQQPANTPL